MDNIAFCFIVKDGDKYLEKNLMKIIQFGDSYLDNYRIYYIKHIMEFFHIKINKI